MKKPMSYDEALAALDARTARAFGPILKDSDEVLLAIAARLGRSLPSGTPLSDDQRLCLLVYFGLYFVQQQPKLKTLRPSKRPGRPAGVKNKLLASTDSQDTLRKRRRRETAEDRELKEIKSAFLTRALIPGDK
jgi:hypothetical protein